MADVDMRTKEKRVPDIDNDFDPCMVDVDDEQTLDEEEAFSSDCSNELDDLQKESEMPIEDLLTAYTLRQQDSPHDLNVSISSEDDILSNEDLTLDKDEIGRDLHLSKDAERPTSADDLMHSVHLSPDHSDTTTLQPLLSRNTFLDCAGDLSPRIGSINAVDDEDSDDDSSDVDYVPILHGDIPDHIWKKTISVGCDYQVELPPLSENYQAPTTANDELMWDPSIIDDEIMIQEYLCEVEQMRDLTINPEFLSHETRSSRDDETALKILMENKEKELSLDKLVIVINEEECKSLKDRIEWDLDECVKFEEAFYNNGKNFFKIHINAMTNRTVNELVEFYYNWKKTERYENFLIMRKAKNQLLIDENAEFLERFHNACTDSASDMDAITEFDKINSANLYNIAEEVASIASSDMDINIDDSNSTPEGDITNANGEVDLLSETITPEPTLMPHMLPEDGERQLYIEYHQRTSPDHSSSAEPQNAESPSNNNTKRAFDFSVNCNSGSPSKKTRSGEVEYRLSTFIKPKLLSITQSAVSSE